MNYYVLLGIPVDADDEAIRHAFRVLARRYHPDTGSGSPDKFREVFEAYQTLRDPTRRAAYDHSLQAPRPVRTRFPVEPLRAESTRREAIWPERIRPEPTRPYTYARRDSIERILDEFFTDLYDDPIFHCLS
jgi:curved DNA-binding protein CbpA